MNNTAVETYTGRIVDLSMPNPLNICIEDIAWHLSRQPRFVGATNSETVYNVAQHSVLVLNRTRMKAPSSIQTVCFQLCALLHDAHEAYMGDFPTPAGQLLDLKQPIKRLKERLQRSIYRGLFRGRTFNGGKFVEYVGAEIQSADRWALQYEGYHLMHSKGKDWADAPVLADHEMYRTLIIWDPAKAATAFLREYERLLNQ